MPPKHLNFILFCGLGSLVCYSTYRLVRPVLVVGDAVQMIERYYVEPVDTDDLMNGAMEGLTGRLDENTSFIPKSSYQAFENSINQEFAGIGILIEQPVKDEPVRVLTPLIGSPALEAGFLPRDQIIRVAGQDVSKTELPDVSGLLKGPIDTSVDVTVKRIVDEEPAMVDLTVKRATIQLESVIGYQRNDDNSWSYRLPQNPRMAYVRLTTFGEKTTAELVGVLKSLNNDFDSLILDVRGNGGGLLTTAVAVCDMFLEEGRVVSTKIRGKVLESVWDASAGKLVDDDKSMVVLIDGNSASASEIVAACLQDHGRAAVAGVRSYGKGTVQNILPLQSGTSALRLTVATYFRPSDKNIHRTPQSLDEDEWGVSPNDGLMVELDDAAQIDLYRRLQKASYPMLDGIDDPIVSDEPGDEVPATEVDAADTAAAEGGSDDVPDDRQPDVVNDEIDVPEVTGDRQLDRAIWHLNGGTPAPEVEPVSATAA